MQRLAWNAEGWGQACHTAQHLGKPFTHTLNVCTPPVRDQDLLLAADRPIYWRILTPHTLRACSGVSAVKA